MYRRQGMCSRLLSSIEDVSLDYIEKAQSYKYAFILDMLNMATLSPRL